MAVFWVVAPCRAIALMVEAARTSETSVNVYQTIRRCNPEDSHLPTHRRENLKSYLGSPVQRNRFLRKKKRPGNSKVVYEFLVIYVVTLIRIVYLELCNATLVFDVLFFYFFSHPIRTGLLITRNVVRFKTNLLNFF
jgi:hypothetical protein